MLEKTEKQEITKTIKYAQIFNHFHYEYTQMLKEFLQRHDITIKEDDCLIDYIIKPDFSCHNILFIPYQSQMPCIMKISQKT